MNKIVAVILCGGFGTRLAAIAKELPKGLVRIAGKPILQWEIENLKNSGITHITLIVGHRHEQIREFFQDGKEFGVSLEYYIEDTPLGTAGALYHLQESLPEEFLVVYGDLIFDIHLQKFLEFHREKGGICTLTAHPNDHPQDSDILILDQSSKVVGLLPKNSERDQYYNNCVNAGLTVLNKDALKLLKKGAKQDFEKDVVLPLINTGQVYAYKTTEYIKDVGTPARLLAAEMQIQTQVIRKRNYSRPQKAIFLDRDGTINQFAGLIKDPNDLKILPWAYDAIKKINHSEYLAIIITNQPVVARNLCSENQLWNIHRRLEMDLGEKEAYIDDLYYCPHHPDRGYPEENRQYKITCSCRKPQNGMILQAVKKHNIDLKSSYFIGDSWRDMEAGRASCLKTIFLDPNNKGESRVGCDYVAKDLLEAVEYILNNKE